ncbi:MAG TPA: hypothetical protein VGL11_05140, partial [Candidatus Binatia bacterium]
MTKVTGIVRGKDVPKEVVIESEAISASADVSAGWEERFAHVLLTRTPLGKLVRWVAGIKSSVHAKLLSGFLMVTLLFVAMGAMSLQAISRTSQ